MVLKFSLLLFWYEYWKAGNGFHSTVLRKRSEISLQSQSKKSRAPAFDFFILTNRGYTDFAQLYVPNYPVVDGKNQGE
jgi:hypothetical protein